MKKAILAICLILSPSLAWSACTGSSPTWTTTPDYASVAGCVASSTEGDTINISAGTESWGTSILAITKSLTIAGAGATTVIQTARTAESWASPATIYTRASGKTIVIKDMTIQQTSSLQSSNGSIYIDATGGTVLISGITFTGHKGRVIAWYGTGVSGAIAGNTFTLDSDNLYGAIIHKPSSGYSALWEAEMVMGGGNGLVIESNTATRPAYNGGAPFYDGGHGATVTLRYNDLTNLFIGGHGCDSIYRGLMHKEVYGNKINFTSGSNAVYVGFRSGTGLVYVNALTTSISMSRSLSLRNYRSESECGTLCSGASYTCMGGGYDFCDGTEAIDGNTGLHGYPCRDQIGRGTNQALYPVYGWANSGESNAFDVNANFTEGTNYLSEHIVANRDYYDYVAAFDGTAGAGCGTLGNRPATCTTGVSYWATDQSCSTLTDYTGAAPTTPISGVLYKCTSTNTWSAYYAPYQYPHPLRGAGTSYTVAVTKTRTDDADGRIRATSLEIDLPTLSTSDSASIQTGTTLILEATEYTGMGSFVTWGGDCASCGSALQCLKTVSGDLSCSGEFSYGETPPTTYTASVTKTGNGTGTVVSSDASINCGATCSYTYEDATSVTLTASCTEGGFVGWGGDCSGQSPTCGLTMSANKSVTAMCHTGQTVGSGPGITVGSGPGITIY